LQLFLFSKRSFVRLRSHPVFKAKHKACFFVLQLFLVFKAELCQEAQPSCLKGGVLKNMSAM
jgi:hypothetical protein